MSGRVKVLRGGKKIAVELPLTMHGGNVRVKFRDTPYQYGEPHYTRQNPFRAGNYVEWQIKSDTEVGNKAATLPDVRFKGDDGENKTLFELSEIFCHFVLRGFINPDETKTLVKKLSALKPRDFLDNHPDCQRNESAPGEQEINETRFMRYELKYPKLARRFSDDDNGVIAEIIIREQDRGLHVQPMLYLCIPVHLLDPPDLTGRCAEQNETARFVFGKESRGMVLELMKIFGMLSESHNKDAVKILRAIAKYAAKP